MKRLILAALVLFVPALATAGPPPDTPLLRAMNDELARSTSELKLGDDSALPYFVGYAVADVENTRITAEFGGLSDSHTSVWRTGSVEVRVGSYELDNSNFQEWKNRGRRFSVPFEDDYRALRRELWVETDRRYKAALEVLESKRAAKTAEESAEKPPPSFAKQAAAVTVTHAPEAKFELRRLESLAKAASSVFRRPELQSGIVTISLSNRVVHLVNSEGTTAIQPYLHVEIEMAATAQAADGKLVGSFRRTSVSTPSQLPSEGELKKLALELSNEVVALRGAPVVDDYLGPVLFEGEAAVQLLERVLVPNVASRPRAQHGESYENPDENLLRHRIGLRVLPRTFVVTDDPTRTKLGEAQLLGGYAADAEGVPAQKVTVIDDGYLKALLSTRAPTKEQPTSNGHARVNGRQVVAGISNLIVEAKGGQDRRALRRKLLAAAREEGLDHALIVRRLGDPVVQSGDFVAWRDADIEWLPLVVVRLGADGKESLVRSVQIRPPNVRLLRRLVGWSKAPTTSSFRPYPTGLGTGSQDMVTISTPDLLVDELDVLKDRGPNPKQPATPSPFAGP